MGQLIEGRWTADSHAPDAKGGFVRPDSAFHDRVTADGSSGFPVEAGRYHLYAAYACPWAHRTLIARALYGLEDAISVSIVDPFMGADGWAFSNRPDCVPDTVNGADLLWQVYVAASPRYSGRVTVPVLWDRERATIVNNESREILRMLSAELRPKLAEVDLAPVALRADIDATIDAIYGPINNGVYRAGFATTQAAYDEAVTALFVALDHWEGVLSTRRFLCGDRMTEADICLFTTLLRFDSVYHGHFKCNLRRIIDYPSLWGFARDVYQTPGVAGTCRLDQIKEHYYRSHEKVNPTRIVPKGPILDFTTSHDRAKLG